jgi:hypothetical protein
MITGIWLSPDRTKIVVQVDDDALTEYWPGNSDGFELDTVADGWITCVPDPLDVHQDCIPLEQA